MAKPSPVPRLTDIIEAVEIIHSEMAGVTLDAFEPDKRKRWYKHSKSRIEGGI